MSLNVVICWSYLLQCQYKSSGKFATISASSMSDSCFLINMTCINKASLYVWESSRANNAFVTHLRKWILPKSFVKSERDKSYCHAIISLFRMTAEQNIHVTTIFSRFSILQHWRKHGNEIFSFPLNLPFPIIADETLYTKSIMNGFKSCQTFFAC